MRNLRLRDLRAERESSPRIRLFLRNWSPKTPTSRSSNFAMIKHVNERSKLTRLQHLILTRLSDDKAPRRAALI